MSSQTQGLREVEPRQTRKIFKRPGEASSSLLQAPGFLDYGLLGKQKRKPCPASFAVPAFLYALNRSEKVTSLPHSEEQEHRPNRVEGIRSKSGHKRSQVPGKWQSSEALLLLTGTSQLAVQKPVTSSSLPPFSKAQANVIQSGHFLHLIFCRLL